MDQHSVGGQYPQQNPNQVHELQSGDQNGGRTEPWVNETMNQGQVEQEQPQQNLEDGNQGNPDTNQFSNMLRENSVQPQNPGCPYQTIDFTLGPSFPVGAEQTLNFPSNAQNYQETPGDQGATSVVYSQQTEKLPSFESAFLLPVKHVQNDCASAPLAEPLNMIGATSMDYYQETKFPADNGQGALHQPLQHVLNDSASAPSDWPFLASQGSAEPRDINENISFNDQSQSGDGAPIAGNPAQMEYILGSTCPFSCKTTGPIGKLQTFGSRRYFHRHIKERHEGYEWCPFSGCNTLFHTKNEGRKQLQRDHYAAVHEGLIKSSISEDGARVDFTVGSICPFMCIKTGRSGKLRNFQTRNAFKRHLDELHGGYERCMVAGCNTLFAKKNERREELQDAHCCTNEHKGRLKCSLCRKTVDNVGLLRNHFSESHSK